MTSTTPPDIAAMGRHLEKIQEEFDIAIATYESWRPAAYDADLRARMGVSYATNTFNIVRGALWRECVLALGRIWDRSRGAIGLTAFRPDLQHSGFMAALMTYRRARSAAPEIEAMMRDDLSKKAICVAAAITKFEKDGTDYALIERLMAQRHAFAHRRRPEADAEGPSLEDAELVEVFNKTAAIISGLWSLVRATAFDPMEAAPIWSNYASHFWAPARGERTSIGS